MRNKNMPATLGELAGKKIGEGQKLSLENLPEILGLKMPELPKNKVGKLRLVHALQQRFGTNYRQYAGVSDLISNFDKEIEVEELVSKNKESRHG